MRAAVLGGTRFIGRALVEDLVGAGHEVLIVHRGEVEPEGYPEVTHVHATRAAFAGARGEVEAFEPEVLIDMMQISRATARTTLEAFPDVARRVVISSMDVYRAYGAMHAETVSDAVPVDETGPVREERYPYRGKFEGMDDYDKLDVEDEFLAVGATVCRLPIVYGEHDYQRREEFILRRVRAGRARIPIGVANLLTTRGYVRDVAAGIRLAAEHGDVAGEIFNLGEQRTLSVKLWARAILDAAGSDAELVTVPEEALPADLGLTGAADQHLLVDSSKARARLGWTEIDKNESIARSVAWHLDNPPATDEDFAADDAALSGVVSDGHGGTNR